MKGSTLASRPDARTAAAAGSDARWEGLTRDDLLRAYRTMLLSRRLDDKEIQLKNQSLIFFQISGAGHEAVLDRRRPAPARRLRLVLSVLPRPRAVPHARHDVARDAAGGGRREGRSEFRRPPDAVALGPPPLNIPSQGSPTGTQCLQAVGAAEAGMMYERITDIPDRQDHFHPDEITYVSIGEGATSEGEFWESLNTACTRSRAGAVSRRRQRLRDLGAGRSADRRRRHLAARRVVPESEAAALRRHRLSRQLPHARRGRGVGAARAQAGVRARQGHSSVLAFAVGRRAVVQDAGGARGGGAARSDDEDARVPARREDRHRGRPRRHCRVVDREIAEATDAALTAPKPSIDTADSFVFSPTVDPTSAAFDTPAAGRGQARHDGGGHQPHAEGRDGAQPAHRRLRRGRRGCQQGGVAAARARQGRRVQGDARPADGIRRRSRLQFAAGRSQHRRPRRRHGDARHQAGRRDPVLRLHLAGDDAAQGRDVDAALSLVQQLVVPDGGARADWRLPARRRAVSQPVGRQHLRALPRHPHRVPDQRRRCGGPAAHVDSLRRPGAVSRAQAPVSPDLQQGRVSRAPTT